MNDQIRLRISRGRQHYSAAGNTKRTATGTSSRIGTPIRIAREIFTNFPSRLAPEQPLRLDEDHHHEEQKRDRVAPFGRKARRTDRDELRDDEGRDETADHV